MKRFATWFAFLFLLFLASCGAAESGTAVANPNNAAAGGSDDSTAASFTAAATVDEAAQLRSDDHTHGAAEPIVTIIEYGDFQ